MKAGSLILWLLVGGAVLWGGYHLFLSPGARMNRESLPAIGTMLNPWVSKEDKLKSFTQVLKTGAEEYDNNPAYRQLVQQRANELTSDPKKRQQILGALDRMNANYSSMYGTNRINYF